MEKIEDLFYNLDTGTACVLDSCIYCDWLETFLINNKLKEMSTVQAAKSHLLKWCIKKIGISTCMML